MNFNLVTDNEYSIFASEYQILERFFFICTYFFYQDVCDVRKISAVSSQCQRQWNVYHDKS